MVWHHKFLYHWIAHLLRNTVVIFFSKQGKYLPTYRKLYGKRLKNDINCCPAAGLCMQLFHFHGGQRNTQFVSVSWKFEVCSLITFYASHKRSFSLYNLYEFWPFRDVEITRVHKITLYALSINSCYLSIFSFSLRLSFFFLFCHCMKNIPKDDVEWQ